MLDNLKWWDGSSWRPNFELPQVVLNLAGTTITTISAPSAMPSGDIFSVSGTVKKVDGTNATNGSVQIQYWTGSAWTNLGSSQSITAGTYGLITSITSTRKYRAVYTAGAGFLNSTSGSVTTTYKPVGTFTKTYNATDSASYKGDGTKRTDTSYLYQGQASSVNGNQRSVLMFDQAQISADLSTGTFYDIQKVELFLDVAHWNKETGGTAVINEHNHSTLPVSNPTAITTNQTLEGWASESGSKWAVLPNAVATRLKASTVKGIMLGAAPDTSLEYYGYLYNHASVSPPKLRITYRKFLF
jgi:hypothetical protein